MTSYGETLSTKVLWSAQEIATPKLNIETRDANSAPSNQVLGASYNTDASHAQIILYNLPASATGLPVHALYRHDNGNGTFSVYING